MKKSIFITVSSILIFSFTSKAQPCVSCDNNNVDFGAFASAVGKENTATGHYSFAMGRASKAIGIASGAFGINTEATAGASFSIGRRIKSIATSAIVLGSGYRFTDYMINGDANTLMIGFNSTAPTFIISESPSTAQHKNRTGRVGIGVSDVDKLEAKLHIRADAGEAAAVFIQPHNWGNGDHASLLLGNAKHGISAKANIGLAFSSENNYVFGDGNVGLGIDSPKEKLHVNGHIALNSKITFKTPEAEIIWGSNKMLFKGYKGLEESKHISKGDGDDPSAVGGLRTIMTLDASTGYVGIRTEKPEYNLHVNGSTFTKYFTLYNEQSPPREGSVLQCDNRGNAYWKDPSGFSVWSVNERNEAYRMNYVGIGTNEPQEMLDVAGNILVNDAIIGKIPANKEKYYDPDFFTLKGSVNTKSSRIMLPKGNNPGHNPIKILNPDIDGGIQFMNEGVMKMDIRRDEVVFGKPDHKLQVKVNGKVWANEVEVQLTGWPDYVFDDNYKLMPLHQLESFIEANNHLPEIPAEKNVLENGIELGKMNALLLKKLEELTLYIIEQQKSMEKQDNKISVLEEKLSTLVD